MPRFGQVVVGPPGSGKTTYCRGLAELLTGLGRPVAVINLDPANDALPYPCTIDIGELVRLDEIMQHTELGPNGAFVYAMEHLERNVDWLIERIERLPSDAYLVFDCPGQVELYTHHGSMRAIVQRLTEPEHRRPAGPSLRLAAVQLVDAQVCTQPAVYVAACLLSLSVMLQLELPHVNVLSKLDLVPSYAMDHSLLAFDLRHFAERPDSSYLLQQLDASLPCGPGGRRLRRLHERLCELLDDFALVAFQPLNVQDKHSLASVLCLADQATGCAFTAGPHHEPLLSPGAAAEAAAAALEPQQLKQQLDADEWELP